MRAPPPSRHGENVLIWLIIAPLLAAPALPQVGDPAADLLGWLLANKRIGPPADAERLTNRLQAGEVAYLDGATRSTAAGFQALVLDPAFAPLSGSSNFDNVRYLLAGALVGEGAIPRARRLLLELIGRKPPSDFRSPAFRKLVDLTLSSGQLEQTLSALDKLAFEPSPDERDEIAYLKGKALLKLGFTDQALEALAAISPTSRLYAAGNCLSGIIALEQGRKDEAEERFCKLVHGVRSGRTQFFLSDDAARVIEHAWLALARLRHDRGDVRRAIETYRRVSADGPLADQARYESCWSLYRAGDLAEAQAAIEDLLARAALGPDLPMAELLLGYAQLGQCQFDRASKLFEQLEREQSALAAAIADPELKHPRLPSQALVWVPVDRNEQRAEQLAGRITEALRRAQWVRWESDRVASGMPRNEPPRPGRALAEQLGQDIDRAEGLKQRLADLRGLIGQGANEQSKLAELHRLQSQVDAAGARARLALDRLLASRTAPPPASPLGGSSLPLRYLETERSAAVQLQQRLADQAIRARRLGQQVDERRLARAAVRVSGWARQAALGHVDAVISRKQALETEVQNLALGRYPLSLLRDLAEAGQLDESSEYWPFDGEHWPDEYE